MPALTDPAAAFIEAATAPRAEPASGTLEAAETIVAQHPDVARGNIYAAAVLGDDATLGDILDRNPGAALANGGPFGWDALTYLCFSRYLRLDARRADAFVRSARALLDAGASATTGWYASIDQ